jgi:hypothetical protein
VDDLEDAPDYEVEFEREIDGRIKEEVSWTELW